MSKRCLGSKICKRCPGSYQIPVTNISIIPIAASLFMLFLLFHQ